ncbi:Methyl-CpG-binding domain-containing protein 13 [Glycine max]|nr:Methyl-CpG-binding domain-containing protein 13 [Glycine max]
MENPDVEKSEETNRQIDSNTKSNSKQQSVEKANEHPDWLPDGWNVEVRTRKSGVHMGSGYKVCYIEPLKGYKFFSKPEVLRYLETLHLQEGEEMHNLDSPNDNSCTLKEKNCGNMDSPNNNSFTPEKEKNCCNMDSPIDNSCSSKKKNCSNMDSPTDVVVEKSTVEDLPPGWVKELKIRKNSKGIRKDPFYIDPASGYVFRSKKDVLRYLESGDIRSCAFKPSRRQVQDEDNLTPPPAAKRQKLKQSAPEQQLSSATEILDKSNLELLDANSSRKGKNANVSSGMMVASVPMGESVEKMHSLEDGAANSSELKKTSDPSSSALLNESLKESEQVLSADDVQEKEHVVNMMENAIEKNHSNYSISKNRKEFNVPHRSSPRLAGSKPVQLANNVMNEQTLQVPKRNLRKSRNTLDIDISEDQTVSKEQPHQQEADKIEDKKPEIQISSNKSSKKKEYHLPRRASKRLAAIEHESMNSKAKLQQSECGPVTVLADQAPTNGKSANKRKKSEPQLGKRENEEMEDEKSESQLSFAFHYSWSDPSLEYAINTLTGVLPPAETDIPKTLVDNVTGKGATTIPETDIPKSLVDNATGKGTTTVPETDIQKTLVDNVTGRSGGSENNLLDTVAGSRDRKSQARSNKPKKKKEVKVPMRLSKRLAGLEPEVLPAERALEYSTRKSCKEEPTATATLTNGVSDHHDAGEETKLTPQASDSLKTEVLGESLNQSEKSYDAQTGHKEQLQKVEAENIGDARSEPQLPLPFGNSWSDPCLEFAIKTLTGALPVDAGDIMPALPPGFDNPPYKQLHGNVVTSINQEAHDNSNQSQNKKELNMVSQLVLRSSSTSYENAPKFTTRQSYLDQGNIIGNLNEEPRHTGNITPPVHHSRNINSLTHEEPLKQNGQVVEGGFVTTEQQLFETGTVNHDNSELQYCAPFMNSWSDPCLEFAFKTLTGVIPVEENLTLQGCFQEPVNYHERRDGGSMLPDLGSSCFSQSDFSFLHDTGVKSMPGQQPSISSSFLPLEKTSLQGFAGVDPQTQFSQCNNNFQRR